MAFEPDQTYEGVITEAKFIQSNKGAEGLNLKIKCPDVGSIYHTVWVSPAAIKYAKKTLVDIGVSENALRLRGFWVTPEDFLVDKPVRIVTESHEYDGKTSVRVKWLNGPDSLPSNMKSVSKDQVAIDRVISLFGGLEESTAGGSTPFDDPPAGAGLGTAPGAPGAAPGEPGTVEPPWDDEDDSDHHTEKG